MVPSLRSVFYAMSVSIEEIPYIYKKDFHEHGKHHVDKQSYKTRIEKLLFTPKKFTLTRVTCQMS